MVWWFFHTPGGIRPVWKQNVLSCLGAFGSSRKCIRVSVGSPFLFMKNRCRQKKAATNTALNVSCKILEPTLHKLSQWSTWELLKHVGPVSFGAGWLLCCWMVGSKPRKFRLQNGFTKAVQMEGVAAVPDSRRPRDLCGLCVIVKNFGERKMTAGGNRRRKTEWWNWYESLLKMNMESENWPHGKGHFPSLLF